MALSKTSGGVSLGKHAFSTYVLFWAIMSAAVFWTLLYRHSQEGADVPEFVYAQF